jgi:hypothetical protein
VFGRLLFHQTGIGVNLSLWVGANVVVWYTLRRQTAWVCTALERRLLLTGLVLGSAFAWRSADMLRLLDLAGLLLVAALLPLAAAAPDGLLASLRVSDLTVAIRRLAGRLALGLAPALLDAREASTGAPSGRRAILLSTGRGLLLAAPPLVVFGALLAAADPGFESLIRKLMTLDLSGIAQHSSVVLGLGWVAAGVVGGVLQHSHDPRSAPVRRQGLGAIEVGLSLGLIDLLFLVFVLSQLHYFFGGDAVVRETGGLTLSGYARRGFFELVWVTALVLPLLLAMHATLRPGDGAAMVTYRLAAGGMVGLALVIVASALHRMALYQRYYGLTELRFYGSAAIVGLAFTLIWLGLTVLGRRPLRFAGGALLAWAAWLAMLHIVNPPAIVARVNLDRAAEGKTFDVNYALELGADAVPTLMNGLDRLSLVDRDQLAQLLAVRWQHNEPSGWRRWTLASSRAVRATASYAASQSPFSSR